MTLTEGALIIFVIVTISQYLIAWGAYFEKKFTAQQLLGSKIKKLQRKNKINVDIDTILNEIPKPSVKNTLPLQIPIGLYNLFVYGPGAVKRMFKEAAEQRRQEQERQQKEKEEEERQQKFEEERIKEKENRLLRRRKQAENLPKKTDEELAAYSVSAVSGINSDENLRNSRPVASGGLWTDDDLAELVRLVKKYPGGTANRWEIIAEMMNRTVSEVTQMAAKLKDIAFKVPGHNESPAEQILQAANKKVKTRRPAEVQIQATAESVWSQAQQQALETAITKYPKTGAFDRWEKIADAVPGKNKDECLARYKYLVELVKKQKAAAEAQKETEEVKHSDALDEQQSIPAKVEEEEVNEKQSKQQTKKKKKGKKISESDGYDEEAYNPSSVSLGGGKAKNKRKEKKKNIEYSYEDYDNATDTDEDYDD